MKKILLVFAFVLFLFSCSNSESKMKSGIKEYLEKNAKDPKSYEFVELKIKDTLTVEEISKDFIESNNDLIKDEKDEIEKLNNNINEYKLDVDYNDKDFKSDFDKAINSSQKNIELHKEGIVQYENQNQKLNKLSKSKEVIGYLGYHKFRIKNGLGALDLIEKIVVFNKDFEVLNMETDTQEITISEQQLLRDTDSFKKRHNTEKWLVKTF